MTPPATPTKAKRATALPPEERRSMIVAATLPLLLEHGDRVTTRQIAEAARIAEGTIFRAFADKDEIIVAVVEAALVAQPGERLEPDRDVRGAPKCRAPDDERLGEPRIVVFEAVLEPLPRSVC